VTEKRSKPRILAAQLRAAALAHGSRIAVRGEAAELSYSALLVDAERLARELLDLGVRADDPVLVQVSNQVSDFTAFLGVWLAQAVVVPVHRTSPPGATAAVQAKAGCRFRVDLECSERARIEQLEPAPDPASDTALALLRDAALVIFTSGSTGSPKGVVLTHTAFAGKLQENQRLLSFDADDKVLLVLNNTFSFGIWLALLTLLAGGTLVVRSRFSVADFIQTLESEKISRLGVVPTMIRALFASLNIAAGIQTPIGLLPSPHLRDVLIGGEPLSTELSVSLRQFIAPAQLYDIYGLTETSTSDFVLLPKDYRHYPGSIGSAASRVEFRIVSERGQVLPPGSRGELELRTPFIMAGYLGDELLTQQAFRDGWFKTGDLAVADAAGFVSIVGRIKELIVRGGNKITPLEIERALMQCPGVAAALVVGLPDPVLGERIHALLIAAAGNPLDAVAIKSALLRNLEKFKHPDVYYLGQELPTGRTGKVERGQLANLLKAGTFAIWSPS
jgi:long-chain acyl-CoA synthetase